MLMGVGALSVPSERKGREHFLPEELSAVIALTDRMNDR